jgi:N utilization substance protein B
MSAPGGTSLDPRRRAREVAVQMLYQWEIGGVDLDEVFETYPKVRPAALDAGHEAFAHGLVRGTAGRIAEIDAIIDEHTANWRLERLAVLDRLVLRLAVFEMLARPETPPLVVINEALELARVFSGEAAVKFVNGVLDAIHRDLEARKRQAP